VHHEVTRPPRGVEQTPRGRQDGFDPVEPGETVRVAAFRAKIALKVDHQQGGAPARAGSGRGGHGHFRYRSFQVVVISGTGHFR
jgi:hypothetical protein